MDESHSPRGRSGDTGHGVRIVRQRLILATLLTVVVTAPSQAGLFRRSSKPDPAVHVPALIQTLRTDTEEKNRAQAASGLREYDAKVFPDILPTLVEALTNDKSPAVRAEAAESIGKVRPITAQAGYALEQAVAKDTSLPVRLSARWALLQYRVLGYIAGVKDDVAMETKEPPIAEVTDAKTTPSATVLRPTPSPMPVQGPVIPPIVKRPTLPTAPALPATSAPKPAPETGEPPIADGPRTPPALVSQPRSPAPIVTIPTPPPREGVSPIPPTLPKSGPTLPPPKELPVDLGKPAPKNGPALPPPPGK